jgi:hypothetical protein
MKEVHISVNIRFLKAMSQQNAEDVADARVTGCWPCFHYRKRLDNGETYMQTLRRYYNTTERLTIRCVIAGCACAYLSEAVCNQQLSGVDGLDFDMGKARHASLGRCDTQRMAI